MLLCRDLSIDKLRLAVATMGTVGSIVVLETRKIVTIQWMDTDNKGSDHPISNSDNLSFGSTNGCNDIYRNFTNPELPTSSTVQLDGS